MERIRQEWASFKALSPKKKLEHIWTYYRWHFLVAAAVICLLVSIVNTVANNNTETLISGCFINNSTSAEGYAHLMEDFREYCGGADSQKVDLIAGRNVDFDAQGVSQQDASTYMLVTCMIAAGTLDYIITDLDSMEDFVEQEMVLDLGELLPAESLANWDTVKQDGAVVGLRLENTAFARNYPLAAQDSCILVIANAPNQENVVRFLEYLMLQ